MIMVRKVFLIVIAMVSFALSFDAYAATFPDKPASENFFVDTANLINEADRDKINSIAEDLLTEVQIPIFVVTINSLSEYGASGLGIEGYAHELFDHWGVGSEQINYGILLLVSAGDRKARIELGKGYEHAYDSATKDIMQSLIIPAFKRNEFSVGIVDGVRGLDAMARGLQLPTATKPIWFLATLILGGMFIVLLIVNLFRNGRSGWAWLIISGVFVVLYSISRKTGKGSSGGFRGGSSGGGGSTGSW